MSTSTAVSMIAVALALAAPASAPAQDAAGAHGQNMAAMKFANFPGLPTCTTGAVQQGDPAKGASIILAKSSTNCVIPWHWHTPTERLMIVSGSARIEPKDGPAMTLTEGGFVELPGKQVHRFTCVKTCTMFVASDGAFDIHFVDSKGQEISAETALAAVKEKAAK